LAISAFLTILNEELRRSVAPRRFEENGPIIADITGNFRES
jgi:hypothetical protein